MNTIVEILEVNGMVNEDKLVNDLIERENAALDLIRVAAMNFGLFPQIVAEVIAESGLGTPLSDEERGMIRTQYQTLIAEIQRQQREGGG